MSKIISSLTRYRRLIMLAVVVILIAAGGFLITSKLVGLVQSVTTTTVYAVVGQPGSFNPLLAHPDTFDEAMSKLLYRGLVTFDNKQQPLGDLADSWTISEDGKNYTLTIKDNQFWDDDEPITSDDVAFTYNFIKDNDELQSRFPFASGIDVNIINDQKVEFVLPEAFSPFLSILQLGILPKHIWGEMTINDFISSKYNLQAVASGGFKVSSITAQDDEIKDLTLVPTGSNDKQVLIFKFFKTHQDAIDAFKLGEADVIINADARSIDELSLWPNVNLLSTAVCGETITMFFNQSDDNKISAKASFRDALYDFIVVSDNHLQLNTSSLPSQHWAFTDPMIKKDITKEQATTNLLAFANPDGPLMIGTGPDDAAKEYANELHDLLQSINFPSDVKSVALDISEGSDLVTRNFDVVFFTQQFSQDPDQYPFWHSTQTDIAAGGLNISGYSNRRMDKSLEDARTTIDFNVRKDNYASMETRLFEDKPALFFSAPSVKTLVRINTSPIIAKSCIWEPTDYLSTD